MTLFLKSPEEVQARVGDHLGYSDYIDVTQDRINHFAHATGDFQWIHTDIEKAATGPFGAPIAHGYLILAIGTAVPPVFKIEGAKMAVNYGLNKVRFISPVKVGSRIRYGVKLLEAEMVRPDMLRIVFESKFECEGSDKPVCISENLGQFFY